MKSLELLDPLTWAKTVNDKWIVHHNLNNSADDWMRHLAALDDGRLVPSCEIARAMCAARDRMVDPKPWFYAGLFHLATAAEAHRFLANHALTRATVPPLTNDETVRLWLERNTPETAALLDRLRQTLAGIISSCELRLLLGRGEASGL